MMDSTTETVLRNLEETQHDFWNISRSTANFLNMMIKITQAKNVIEVGTSNGYSGIWLAKALKETGGHLTTIEFYEKRIVLAKENFKTCGVADIIDIKQGSAIEVLEEIPQDEVIDFAFIDANKAQYVEYYNIIDKHLKVGGIIAADNITSHAEKVKTFVDAISANPNYQVEILDLPAGLLLARKNS
ncbi:MAG: O-methyltransferase [Candidatus Gastranaerophilaceae bacterium]